ncbi:Ger(x)C family spore germination protein [Paenibacillus sp. 1011MAR3C5]|uniref:Ger(x)C family spore germination protein n=1 Tax=Paenibacillus sp. 1011MAR3C5 TaxID=1675787 RepID=UPI000E6C29FC|nr:Ger(x)C family spore germination protein [Paenibacillus sp. 1011MAR3C5]RJE83876.1 Ger(x)C family spore germination protein [Paenibacillus sp. 1011MAR3C5]
MNNQLLRLLLCTLAILIFLPLAGCWSSKEIENLGIIVGTSLDLEKKDPEHSRSLLTVTNQFLTSETIGTGIKEGKTYQKAYINISETGDAALPTLRNMILRFDKRAFAEHSKVLVIGENLARSLNLQQTLDFFIREQEMRPSGLILIARDRASRTLESKNPIDIPAFQLIEMTQGHDRTTKILPPMTLTKIQGKLNSGASFLLQSVSSMKGEIKFTGAAVIKGKSNKLSGFLNEEELEGLTWLSGKGKGGLVRGFDEATGLPIVYEILSMKSVITSKVDGDRISFDVIIESEGRIAEHWDASEKELENGYLKRTEQASEKEVERLVKNVLHKIQHKYQADVSGFGNRLRIEYPRVWEKVKHDWDQTFSEVPIHCEVKITIKDYGTSDH